ncbi:MAG: PIN domain-containing protein [Eubacterium sp.]|nr:PIN domain-containing protein [Eubacterium sp.]
MNILIDTNVIIDFLITREPFFHASSKIIAMCANGELSGYIAFHSIPNLWYIMRKIPEQKRRKWLVDLCGFLKVISVKHEEVLKAIEMAEFKDFEDCLQDRCAKSVCAKYILTRNEADFIGSEVPAISPEVFLATIPG